MKKSLVLLMLSSLLMFGGRLLAAEQDVRLVVDISGSMNWTDPNNLRVPATQLLIDLLPEGVDAGIWTFARQVNMLVPHGEVDSHWRTQAQQEATKINSVGLYTHIDRAIETVTWDLDWSVDKDRHIILLSDGLVDISQAETSAERSRENQASRDHLLRERLPQLVEAGFTIHTLALSDEADHDLMATLAQRSGGLHAIAYEAEDLTPLLMQILNRMVDSEQVPLRDNQFTIDPLINEFTALVFHQPDAEVQLHSPDGQSHSKANPGSQQNWHAQNGYTLVTVEQPAAGDWQIATPVHPDNRITIVSDLKLHTSRLPATVYRGFSDKALDLEAWLTEEGQRIDRAEFLRLLDVELRHHQADLLITEQDLTFDSDLLQFSGRLTDFSELGEQQLTVVVDGHTFKRQATHSFNVQDVVAAHLQLPEDGGTAKIVLRAQHPDLEAKNVGFKVTANDQAQPLRYRGDGEWQVNLSDLDPGQDYQLNIEAEGEMKGEAFRITLPSLALEAGSVRVQDRTPEPIIEPEATPSQQPETEASDVASEEVLPDFVPNIAPQIAPLPLVPTPSPDAITEAVDEEVAAEPETEVHQAQEAEVEAERGFFELNLSPIRSWDDPRMLWVYIALGLANILLFGLAFVMYRRFIQRRQARHDAKTHDDEEVPDLDDLEFDLDDELESEPQN